jgi:peptidoglycan/xylan/chitin deacetylase (PgdA/CDA1 family)
MSLSAPDTLQLAWPAVVGGAAAVAALAAGTFAPASSFWGPVLSRATRDRRTGVALTFDDGPTPGASDRVLDALAELRVKAAFFVVGRNALRFPGLVARMHEEGHVVGNHTLDHAHFGLFRRWRYWQHQLTETDEIIRNITGRRPALFRPPMGIKTLHIARAAAASGYATVTWSRRAFDGVGTSSDRIVRRLGPASEPGDILLLHDGVEPNAPGRDPGATVAALRPLVETLRSRGLEPRRVDELLGLPAYQGE